MQVRDAKVRRFLPTLDRFEPAVLDSSAAKIFKECPRKYFYRIVLGFNERETPPFFAFGTALHLVMESWFKNPNVPEEQRKKNAILLAMDYHTKHITPNMIVPKSKWEFLTLPRLVASANALIEFFKAERNLTVLESEQIGNKVLADGESIGGRLDQICRSGMGHVMPRDLKTTSKKLDFYDRQIEPNDQFIRYMSILSGTKGEPVTSCLVLVVMNNKSDGPVVRQFLTNRSVEQIERWEQEQILLHKWMETCRQTDIWPMEETNCGWCVYRKVCTSGSEASIESTLKLQFVQKPWDFTRPEDEE